MPSIAATAQKYKAPLVAVPATSVTPKAAAAAAPVAVSQKIKVAIPVQVPARAKRDN
jgi:hypothetical protein